MIISKLIEYCRYTSFSLLSILSIWPIGRIPSDPLPPLSLPHFPASVPLSISIGLSSQAARARSSGRKKIEAARSWPLVRDVARNRIENRRTLSDGREPQRTRSRMQDFDFHFSILSIFRFLLFQPFLCTEMRFILCKTCQAGPRQGQAEQLSKSRNKFHQTTYKE